MTSDEITITDLARHLRVRDYDRFLCIQRALVEKRAALYVVTSLHAELAGIAETVSEPLLGHIRLAWWREALEEIAAGNVPRRHPLVLALAELHTQHAAVWPWLLKAIESRAADLDAKALEEEDSWLSYLDGTAGALHHAWALILDAGAAETQAARIAQEARAYAMVGLMRALPYLAQHNFQRVPKGQLQQHGVERLEPGAEVETLVVALAQKAQAMLATAPWPKRLTPLAALSRLARVHARQLHRGGGAFYNQRSTKFRAVLAVLAAR